VVAIEVIVDGQDRVRTEDEGRELVQNDEQGATYEGVRGDEAGQGREKPPWVKAGGAVW